MRNMILLLCVALMLSWECSGQSTDEKPLERVLLAGDYPDPSIWRDGNTYYMVCSSFEYMPGLLIFRSNDLINWQPITCALKRYVGSVYAPDIVKHGDKWYIYFPTVGVSGATNRVVWADAPEGPWSDPIDLKIGGIDPGHAVDSAENRYLMMSDGKIVPLAADGLSATGPVTQIYEGWKFPAEWNVEGFCLEGPKVRKIGKYYYMLSAEGGTAGPPTSHMVVVARAENLMGPWENAPNNPLIHTYSHDEPWWSKGHGSLIDTPEGTWYVVYHAYERGFYTLGRQTLMQQVELTSEGWFKPSAESTWPSKTTLRKQEFSDDFSTCKIGTQWHFIQNYNPQRTHFSDGGLNMQAQGNTLSDCSPMLFIIGDHAYEMEVEILCPEGVSAGLTLFYNPKLYAGVGLQEGEVVTHLLGRAESFGLKVPHHLWLRLRNDHHIVSSWYSSDGKNWIKTPKSCETSAYNHNIGEGFMSLRPGIYAAGEGEVVFRNFIYRTL